MGKLVSVITVLLGGQIGGRSGQIDNLPTKNYVFSYWWGNCRALSQTPYNLPTRWGNCRAFVIMPYNLPTQLKRWANSRALSETPNNLPTQVHVVGK